MPSQYADRPKPARLHLHGQAGAGPPPPPPPPPRPELQEQLPCPRCDSTNTKFCYYNNYNLSQPRHFCKSCRRYWTRGGTLRDIPVGGGTHRNPKRPRTSAAATSSAPALPPLDGSVVIHGSVQSSGVAAEAPKPVCGSFASLLTTQGPACFLALGGLGRLGLDDMAFGLGRGTTSSWAFHGEAGGGAAAAGSGREEAFGRGGTWQLESGVEGGGDCFNFPSPTWPYPFPAATGLK